jgi:hypothetical protein
MAGRIKPSREEANRTKQMFQQEGRTNVLEQKGERPISAENHSRPVGRYLVVSLGKNPDWVWNLKAAMRSNRADKDTFEVRVFDAALAADKGIKVHDYHTFDEHPEMILYEGWFNKRTFETKIQGRGKSD